MLHIVPKCLPQNLTLMEVIFLTDGQRYILPSWGEGSWGWRETLWYTPQSLQLLRRGWDKTAWLLLCLPFWETNHAASPPVCPALCRDEGQLRVKSIQLQVHQTARHFTRLVNHEMIQFEYIFNWIYAKIHKEMVLLFLQAAFLAGVLLFLLFLTIIIRTVEVWIKRRRTPQRAILKHPKVLCSPFAWSFTLSK